MTNDPRRCKARTRSGEQCKSPPVSGADVCRMHGGSSPRLKAKIERNRAEREGREAVELFGGRRDVDPATALMELVGAKAAELEFWRARVHKIQQDDEESLTFGVTRIKAGGEDRGTTTEAKPHVALTLMHKAEQDLAAYAAASLKAGVDESLLRITEATAGQFRRIVEAVLADPRLGITADDDTRTAVIVDALRAGIGGNPMHPSHN